MSQVTDFSFLGYGVGLRPVHYDEILKGHPSIDWFEILSENYMVAGGRPLFVLEKIRERYPVVMHGVSLSIGSTDPLNRDYLKSLKNLAERVEPSWISDHLCWTGVGGHNLHDLLPLPYTEEAVGHVVRRVKQVQEFLGRSIALENVSSYLTYKHSTLSEWDFLKAVVEEADCQILLDINNIYVSSVNHSFDPIDYLNAIPRDRVAQFHLAGYSEKGTYLLDTHDHPVTPPVWDLYEKAVERFGEISTLIEWDDHIPAFQKLLAVANQARMIYQGTREKTNPPKNSETPLEADCGT